MAVIRYANNENLSELSMEDSQLVQLCRLTHDEHLLDGKLRNKLCSKMLAIRVTGGWNIITSLGIEYLEKQGFIKP